MNSIVDGFNVFVDKFVSFGNSIVSVFSYIWSILKTLWFGLTSLLTGIWDLIVDLFNGSIFTYVGDTLYNLTFYIGTPAVVFITSLLLIIIFRIGLAFVFKIFRLNIDYHSLQEKNDFYEKHAKLKK